MNGKEPAEAGQNCEAEVVRALEQRTAVVVPEDFANRMAQAMPARTLSEREIMPSFGRAAGYAATVLIMLALVLLARIRPEGLVAGTGFTFAVELFLVAQLLVVGFWLGKRRDSQ